MPQISSLTLPVALTKVAPYSTTTPPYSINFNLSPGLKAGKPLKGQVPHRNESPRLHLPHPVTTFPSLIDCTSSPTGTGPFFLNNLLISKFSPFNRSSSSMIYYWFGLNPIDSFETFSSILTSGFVFEKETPSLLIAPSKILSFKSNPLTSSFLYPCNTTDP